MQFFTDLWHNYQSVILAALPGIALAAISEWMGTHPGSKYDSILQWVAAVLAKKSQPTQPTPPAQS